MSTPSRRVIEVNRPIISPGEPRLKTVRPRKIADYPHVPAPYLDVARKLSSPLLMGPPICDELIAFVRHLCTEEEAAAVRHLGVFSGRSAADVARAEHITPEDARRILDQIACQKRAIAGGGPPENRRYRLLPIMPGVFEMVLIACTPESLSAWHRRFIELFETLYETGYALDYQKHVTPMVRYLPVGKSIEAHPMALPSDQLEVVLDRFDTFGVGQCQCRLTTQTLGRGCGKPLGNCTVMGQWAQRGIEDGWLKPVSKNNVLEIKREAESHGLATWMMNVESTRGQASCSCCGCCCHAMRVVTEFNVPGMIAPPHFMPRLDQARCTFCGKCGKGCPMGAIVVDARNGGENGTWRHLTERCVGCGLCAVACERQHALAMEPVPDYKLPYRSWFALIARAAPGMLRTSWQVWRER